MFRMNRQIGSLTFNVLTLISIHSVDGKNNNKEKRKQGHVRGKRGQRCKKKSLKKMSGLPAEIAEPILMVNSSRSRSTANAFS